MIVDASVMRDGKVQNAMRRSPALMIATARVHRREQLPRATVVVIATKVGKEIAAALNRAQIASKGRNQGRTKTTLASVPVKRALLDHFVMRRSHAQRFARMDTLQGRLQRIIANASVTTVGRVQSVRNQWLAQMTVQATAQQLAASPRALVAASVRKDIPVIPVRLRSNAVRIMEMVAMAMVLHAEPLRMMVTIAVAIAMKASLEMNVATVCPVPVIATTA